MYSRRNPNYIKNYGKTNLGTTFHADFNAIYYKTVRTNLQNVYSRQNPNFIKNYGKVNVCTTFHAYFNEMYYYILYTQI